jgi:hypothetical protein
MAAAEAVVAPCSTAAAFAARHLDNVTLTENETIRPLPRRIKRVSRRAQKLGLLPLRTSADELKIMRGIVRSLHEVRPDLSITVVGQTLDDILLMKNGNCFVTGPVEPADLDRILSQYALERLLIGVGSPLFGHPMEAKAITSGLPIARLDWSFGQYQVHDHDAVIDPTLTSSEIAEFLVQWMEGH